MKQKVNVGRKELNIFAVEGDSTRVNILNKIKNMPMSITQLENDLKINRGTLKHHLNILKRSGHIKTKKEEHLAGKPVMIYYVDLLSKKINSVLDSNITLSIIKSLSKQKLGRNALFKNIKKENNVMDFEIISKMGILESLGYIANDYSLTKKGKEFLNEHKQDVKK